LRGGVSGRPRRPAATPPSYLLPDVEFWPQILCKLEIFTSINFFLLNNKESEHFRYFRKTAQYRMFNMLILVH
jgi:hypothetical protein